MIRRFLLLLLLSLPLLAEDISYNRYFLVERVFLLPFVFKYADDLGIDDKQMESIKEFVKENEREIERNKKILDYLMRKAKMMMLEGAEEKEIKEVLSDIALVKMEMSMINAKTVSFLKNTLTPEQFEKLKNIIVVRLFELQR